MKKFIQLSNSDMSGYDTDYTLFFGGQHLFFDVRDIENFMECMQKEFTRIKPLCSKTFYRYIDKMEDKKDILVNLVSYSNYELEEEELELMECEELKMLLNEWYGEVDLKLLVDVYDYYDFVQGYIRYLRYKVGVAGYSQWSYYITVEDESYVKDLYEGYNFYDMALLDESGKVVDSVDRAYIPNEEDLIKVIKFNYEIDEKDVVLVDNEEGKYFSLPKVRM